MKSSLSVVLAVYNEEENLADCLESVKDLADEIVIVDGGSEDKTVEVAKKFGARVIETDNPPNFHINKQKALEAASNGWILQLDADERVSKELVDEIRKVIKMDEKELEQYQNQLLNKQLFLRHQKIVEQRDGRIGTDDGLYTAFFVPRLNFFLGEYLRHGGVYPDGVIRLVKKGKAHFPCKDVHEQIAIEGRVGWLQHDLLHVDSPSFERYLERSNRYTDLIASQLKEDKIKINPATFIDFIFIKPIWWFLLTFLRHKGFVDGFPGFVFALFSALRFPIAYTKLWSTHASRD